MAIDNMVAVTNGKGGTLKSTTVSHVAAIAAASGWQVLVIDADPQGNTSRDLGYVPDGGEALSAALLGASELKVSTLDTRPGLSFVAGGDALVSAAAELSNRLARADVTAFRAFTAAVQPLAKAYDLILVDSGPGDHVLRKMILAAAQYVLIPCKTDQTSIPDGLANVFRTIAELRIDLNPTLEVLGVILGPVRSTETKRLARSRARATEVLGGDDEVIFHTSVRETGKIADDCRDLGVVATEYESRADSAQRSRVPWYKRSRADRAADQLSLEFSDPKAASGLARDWQALTDEILARFVTRREVQQ